jgi:hypothetical protein
LSKTSYKHYLLGEPSFLNLGKAGCDADDPPFFLQACAQTILTEDLCGEIALVDVVVRPRPLLKGNLNLEGNATLKEI